MKIQSRFKDYYDFVSHQFGQDPDIVYVREPIRGTDRKYRGNSGAEYFPWDGPSVFHSDHIMNKEGQQKYRLEYIVAGPHWIPFLVESSSRFDKAIEQTIYTRNHIWIGPEHAPLFARFHEWDKRKFLRPPSKETIEKLIKVVGSPVFLGRYAHADKVIEVDRKVPILKDYDFPSHIPAEALWQDIYSTITNVLRKNPDKDPPVVLADEFRIHAAGFDLKSSFRHPVNPKKVK